MNLGEHYSTLDNGFLPTTLPPTALPPLSPDIAKCALEGRGNRPPQLRTISLRRSQKGQINYGLSIKTLTGKAGLQGAWFLWLFLPLDFSHPVIVISFPSCIVCFCFLIISTSLFPLLSPTPSHYLLVPSLRGPCRLASEGKVLRKASDSSWQVKDRQVRGNWKRRGYNEFISAITV